VALTSKPLIILGSILLLSWLITNRDKPYPIPLLRWEERWGEVPRTNEFYE